MGHPAPWATGKEYVYRLHAISLSDIPELGAQSAGIKFDLQLIVHCRDANTIVVKVRASSIWRPTLNITHRLYNLIKVYLNIYSLHLYIN